MIFAFSLWLNSLWYGSSVFPWDQFVLICPPFSVLRAEMRCRGAALKANAQLVSGRRRSVLLRLNSWSSLTLSYTILTDREILILTAFIFSPHCVWCRCKCIKLDWRTVLISYDRLYEIGSTVCIVRVRQHDMHLKCLSLHLTTAAEYIMLCWCVH